MNHFELKHGELWCEDVSLKAIAEEVGTPVYVYSRATLERHAQVFSAALSELADPWIAYALKSNLNLAVIKVLQRQGFGADVVSAGEMARALAAGVPPSEIVFSGVGKTHAELTGALDVAIGQFNLESEEEAIELAQIAEARGLRAPCALRVNPNVDAGTHEKISTGKAENKFGVPIARAEEIFAHLANLPGLNLRGVAVHIGSQLSSLEPMETAFTRLGELITRLRAQGHRISHADLGGGLGVPYKAGAVLPSPADYGAMVARATRGWDVRLIFEPGRVISGNAGVLLTRVIRVKRASNGPPFIVVDAAMNDLARPALYGAWHDFEAVQPSGNRMTAHIVGPIC